MDQNVHGYPLKLLPCCFFYTNHGSFILIFFGKTSTSTTPVECIVIEEHEGEELVKDFSSFHIDDESPSPEM